MPAYYPCLPKTTTHQLRVHIKEQGSTFTLILNIRRCVVPIWKPQAKTTGFNPNKCGSCRLLFSWSTMQYGSNNRHHISSVRFLDGDGYGFCLLAWRPVLWSMTYIIENAGYCAVLETGLIQVNNPLRYKASL